MDGAYCQCLPPLLVTLSTQHIALSTQHMALSTQANVTRLMVNIKWFWHNAHFIYISYSAKNSEHLVEEFCIILFSVHTNFVSKHVLMSMPPSVRRQCTNGISFEVKLPFLFSLELDPPCFEEVVAQIWSGLLQVIAFRRPINSQHCSTWERRTQKVVSMHSQVMFFFKHNYLYY